MNIAYVLLLNKESCGELASFVHKLSLTSPTHVIPCVAFHLLLASFCVQHVNSPLLLFKHVFLLILSLRYHSGFYYLFIFFFYSSARLCIHYSLAFYSISVCSAFLFFSFSFEISNGSNWPASTEILFQLLFFNHI